MMMSFLVMPCARRAHAGLAMIGISGMVAQELMTGEKLF